MKRYDRPAESENHDICVLLSTQTSGIVRVVGAMLKGGKKALSPSLIQGNKAKFFSLQVGRFVCGKPAKQRTKNFLCCVKFRSTWKSFTVPGRATGLYRLIYAERHIALLWHIEPAQRTGNIFLYHTHLYNFISAHLLQRSYCQGGYT